MEFKFNINYIFKSTVTKLDYTLLPSNFSGDRRSASQCVSQVADILDAMGVASAKAQDLEEPITSADKMRNLDHTLYLMIDPDDNDGKGSVVGLLRTGIKNLFLFDPTGMVHEKKSLCILDFYIHESKQRSGLGRKLYDYMLQDECVEPCKLAFDKPSNKCLSFLNKHYGLSKICPQNNNFVVFEDFFDDKTKYNGSMQSTSNSGAVDRIEKDDRNCYNNHSIQSIDYKPTEYGRHSAYQQMHSKDKGPGWNSSSKNEHVDSNHHTTLW